MSRVFGSALCSAALVTCVAAAAIAQTPRPFPQPGTSRGTPPEAETGEQPARPVPGTVAPPRPVAPPAAPVRSSAAAPAPEEPPTEALLGVPIFPNAQFIASYDAGQGQRYYLFGTTAGFAEAVAYYRNVLKQKGDLVFEGPAVQMFELGRFREESMAFPPGVTVKDYTWGGSAGYPNPKAGAQPERFPTVLQIVAVPPQDRGRE